MGLAAPRKRRKIAHDPNNTSWTRADDTYGQRILASQGWTPGSYLGAADAAHASHYSSASASHVRVHVKDDSLGLGAIKGQAENQTTGLGIFQDLLGRLNGKSDTQIEREQNARMELGRRIYAEQRFGSTRFVKGGYLVGDRVQELEPSIPNRSPVSTDAPPTPAMRVSDVQSENLASSAELQSSPKKKRRKKLTLNQEPEACAAPLDPSDDVASSAISDRPVFESHLSSFKEVARQDSLDVEQRDTDVNAMTKGRAKDVRRERKEARRLRREQKQARRASKASREAVDNDTKSITSIADSPDTYQNAPMYATARARGVRLRYIQQKRMSAMNPQALREILMVKSQT